MTPEACLKNSGKQLRCRQKGHVVTSMLFFSSFSQILKKENIKKGKRKAFLQYENQTHIQYSV